jgi:hypothetical protein
VCGCVRMCARRRVRCGVELWVDSTTKATIQNPGAATLGTCVVLYMLLSSIRVPASFRTRFTKSRLLVLYV